MAQVRQVSYMIGRVLETIVDVSVSCGYEHDYIVSESWSESHSTKHDHDSYLGDFGETRRVSLNVGETKRSRKEKNRKEKLV